MKTPIQVHTGTASLDNDSSVVYFSRPYLANQNHDQLVSYESDQCFLPLSLNEDLAISIPRSPFGSFLVKGNFDHDQFLEFLRQVKEELSNRGITTLQVKHPTSIYSSFVKESWLEESGFKRLYSDINQQIPLSVAWKDNIHLMQKRKLDALQAEQFEFRKMGVEELEIAHQFIAVCRQAQGLIINVDLELLQQLSDSTEAYDLFGVFRDGKISSVCIAVRVTGNIAYYYLPATSPMFRTQSPMVLLIEGMVDHYRSLGFHYLDMGISSIEGKPQESLRVFKERMGALQSDKTTWQLRL